MPEPLGEAVTTTTTMDANLNHCLATGKSLTGCLHFVNKIAAKLMGFYWIQSAYNLSDMLSKNWDHPTVYPRY